MAPRSALNLLATAYSSSSSASSSRVYVRTLATTSAPTPIAGPHKLPHLLSVLPSAGRHSLVRPEEGNPSELYLVTRSRLKFTNADPPVAAEPTADTKNKVAGAKVGTIQGTEPPQGGAEEARHTNPVDGGIVRAHGKAWGMIFKNGQSTRVRLSSHEHC